ncbi:MAG: ABC transporter permease subunit [Puniceicoccales bacterium]|jgi:ABC-2 type transport system permease protein|nr:ABC transporter permease subunit [Puniceicoccales bacterium]
MRTFRVLLAHELHLLAITASTYIAAAVFLGLTGFLYWFSLHQATDPSVNGGPTPVQSWFGVFWVPALVIIPQITMRAFAGESRSGMLGALFSTPVRPFQVVCAKFVAAYFFHMLLWVLALLFPLMAYWLLPGAQHSADGLLPLPTLLGGFVFVATSGSLYVATGLLASSLTRSTLVAALLCICALLLLLTAGSLLQQINPGLHVATDYVAARASYLDTFRHLDLFLRGIVDTRPLFLFGSGTMLALGLATLFVKNKA